ncbi:MAG: ribokinase [Alphaproteobacteria bacterium]|nr:ribokinase [Alphaproteobacteria bacterium]
MLIVFGSINQDMYFPATHLPQPGETVLCPHYETAGGGKGANQALAAARWGAKVALVSRVGDDGTGMRLLAELRREGVMTSGVAHSAEPTGCAIIVRDPNGENQIVVAQGANADVTAEQIPDDILGSGNTVLMQMEIPPEHNWDVIRRAKARGARTILNLAPAIHVPLEIMEQLDYLIVNEIEVQQIAEKLGLKVQGNAPLIARALAAHGKLTCIVTLGPQGAIAMTPENKMIRVSAMKLDKVEDTTGAGDAYCGTLAAALHAGVSLPKAMKQASIAGSLACMKKGAQASFPHLGEIEDHLDAIDDAHIEDVPAS